MVKPILYTATLSPPGRAVVMTARAIGLDIDIVPINLMAGEHMTEEFLKRNPQHTIPTLDDNGNFIWDSHAICTYLIAKYGKDDTLYPKDPLARAKVDQGLHFDSGVLFARLRFLYEPILYYGSPDMPEDRVEYIRKAYGLLEAVLEKHDYLSGDSLTLADIASVATVSSSVVEIDAGKYPKLLAWMERLSKLPYYPENKAGGDELKEIFKTKYAANQAK